MLKETVTRPISLRKVGWVWLVSLSSGIKSYMKKILGQSSVCYTIINYHFHLIITIKH